MENSLTPNTVAPLTRGRIRAGGDRTESFLDGLLRRPELGGMPR